MELVGVGLFSFIWRIIFNVSNSACKSLQMAVLSLRRPVGILYTYFSNT